MHSQGRKVVAVTNDITYQSGAFGPREDAVFRAATVLALQQHIPLVYLAANSGKLKPQALKTLVSYNLRQCKPW
jgi:acetyl-CoA carboxylase carboxyltransferase component